MSRNQRIGAFCSQGPHYKETLQVLRSNAPEAHIVAIVPQGYPIDQDIQDCGQFLPGRM